MRQFSMLAGLLFLMVTAGWGQDVPKRTHTRPPYSGPRKGQGQIHAKDRKTHKAPKGHLPQPKSDHVLAH
jgi:hypothetical protein